MEPVLFSEADLLPISALQHLLFCERQCALIHVERLWKDNRLTLEGSRLHRRVDEVGRRREVRGDRVILRGLSVRSLRLGLTGIADAVEVVRGDREGALPPELERRWRLPVLSEGGWHLYPVEYKRGRKTRRGAEDVQLCAQGLCLEEMLGVAVVEGGVFHASEKRRRRVPFDEALRRRTEAAARRLRALLLAGRTPTAAREPKCRGCSLLELCLPAVTGSGRSAVAHVARALAALSREEGT